MLRPNIDTFLALVLLPLLIAQTLWVRNKAMQLPEPTGPRQGQSGSGETLRLLVIGDSSAAGVGVDRQEQALTPQLAGELGAEFDVHWHLCARNGAITADAPELLQGLNAAQIDVAYVIFGVNDAKNLRPEMHWRRDVALIIRRLRDHHGAKHIFFSGLPRVEDFPLIPNPLRAVLALRTRRFDRVLQKIAAQHGCFHLPLSEQLDRSGMAVDGFHPGAPIYTDWAVGAAEAILERL